MNISIVEDLINWADDNKKEDFREFILFMNKLYEKQLEVNMSYSNFNTAGKLKRWNVFYNKRFSDFDIDVLLDSYEYTITFKRLTMENFKNEGNNKFIIRDCENNICKFELKEGM